MYDTARLHANLAPQKVKEQLKKLKHDEELKGLRKRRPLLLPPPHERALTFAMQFIWEALQEFQQSTSREFHTSKEER